MADDDGRWVVLCSRDRLAAQKIICATVAGVAIILVQEGDTIVACERACPHEQADLSRGHVSGGQLHCPHHRASFSLASGEISPGWPSRSLHTFPIRLDEAQVWIDSQAVRAASSD
ncbi:Rieske (2Fe-2S) protein [Tardiphaga sp.]|uniref:Rieske (2Fe-2S) protein n=1 Tax=Tardiphaga sp. TaxID=1926292 RepID=UPI0037DA3754